MPRYLRWTLALTSAIVGYFAFSFIALGITLAVGHEEVSEGPAALVVLGGLVVPILVALAINDWMAARYPPVGRSQERSQERGQERGQERSGPREPDGTALREPDGTALREPDARERSATVEPR